MRVLTIFFALFVFFVEPSVANTIVNTKTVYGYIEKATLVEQSLILPAKLDTGARSSSLHAINIQKIKKAGKTYVRFTVPYSGGESNFLCEYFGRVRIKPRAQESHPIERPVVWMKIKVGDKTQDIRVNLTDRSRFMYPLLLGRQAIVAFNGVVDPSIKYETSAVNSKLESQ
jgi:hypothetical protein